MRKVTTFFAILMMASTSLAQDIAPVTSPQPVIAPPPEMIVAPKAMTTNRMVIIVDKSDSMDNGRLVRAISAVLLILQPHGIDEQQLKLITFNDNYNVWPGFTDPEVRKNPVEWKRRIAHAPADWTLLPDERARGLLTGWLFSQDSTGGTTPHEAVQYAVRQPRDHITIVLISDGEFNQSRSVQALKAGQKWREQQGLTPAILGTYGVGNARARESMIELGTLGGGGFWHEPKPKPMPQIITGPW